MLMTKFSKIIGNIQLLRYKQIQQELKSLASKDFVMSLICLAILLLQLIFLKTSCLSADLNLAMLPL